MHIRAKITGIKYKIKFAKELQVFDYKDIDVNKLPASSIVQDGNFSFGLSKWVSPKRTRSYPYERVYNTLGCSKRITIIPIIKDEGKRGDRDFIQFDTVSLMSLLDVSVIFAYYSEAEKNPRYENKITNQRYDNELIKKKISEIKDYHSSALHWNLKETKETFPNLIKKIKKTYQNLAKKLGVKFHAEQGIDKFSKQFLDGYKNFMDVSRQKGKEAQKREMQTIQPKEALSTETKATITIENYLGGKYYFTTDEMRIEDYKTYLIEGKHSKTALLPSASDIKDGLLKMFLYTNLEDVFIGDKEYKPMPELKLTSANLSGSISSKNSEDEIQNFINKNNFNKNHKQIVDSLFAEARQNNFTVIIEKA